LGAVEQAKITELGLLIFWIQSAVQLMVKNSIWWILLTVNSNITRFVKQLTAEQKQRPIFELWPPQSRALLEEGLLDPVKRAIVIQMPTSSGKTLLAEFRILQTKQNNPDSWIAYIVPTRALVNQITNRLREDLSPLGLIIEQAVPAFELDPIEEELLTGSERFDVLVTTQEKLDLLIRSEKLSSVSRPLGLVIVDEAHNIKSKERGLKTEMLLTIINREFANVHFLLLSPFVPNIEDLANWLDSERSAKISIRWRPNEQLVGVAFPEGRGKNWNLKLRTLFTSQPTIEIVNDVIFSQYNPFDKTKSKLNKGEISSILATLFSRRKGGVIVIVIHKDDAVSIAKHIYDLLPSNGPIPEEVQLVRKYIAAEFGEEYQLYSLLEKGVGFHHAGVYQELRYLLEWLMSRGHLNVMVATTTLAQGVNFPISSIVMNDYKIGTPPAKMTLDDFWNIAGRAGRADQDTLGIIAFSSKSEDYAEIKNYVKDQVSDLVSHLETLVLKASERGRDLDLKLLVKNDPEWSNFVQYLCHVYRQIGNHSRFVAETETIIKATYGYQRIKKSNPALAQAMVRATVNYAEEIQRIDSQTLSLVDQTGFSPDSIRNLRDGIRDVRLSINDLSVSGIFNTQNHVLSRLMGKLLNVDELDIRTESGKIQGDHLAYIISKWVKGDKIADIAQHELFENQDRTKSINKCIITLNNIITYSSWGLGVIESLAIKKEEIERLSKREQYEIRSIPAMIYFGVDTLEGVVMRNIGVPRSVAKQMGESYKLSTGDDVPTITKARTWIKSQDSQIWNQCAPRDSNLSGDDYRKVWQISNGEYRG
jgi:replicative superfamily II helicase